MQAKAFSHGVYHTTLCRRSKQFSLHRILVSTFAWVHSFQFCFIFQVTYQSDHFLDKNRDYVVVEHQELLNASKCSFVSGLFPSVLEENTKASKSSIATRFKVWFSYPIIMPAIPYQVGWRKNPYQSPIFFQPEVWLWFSFDN